MIFDIILITYNQQDYIAQAVNSILSQKIPDKVSVRVIIADDVSTDNTLSIIKERLSLSGVECVFLEKDRNVGYIMNYKQAFNSCVGDYVAILEGDDYWLEGHLQQHIFFLESHKDCSMSMNLYHQLYTNGQLCKPGWCGDMDFRKVSLKEQIGSGNQLGNLSACVFRGELVKKLPESLFELNMADWELGAFMAQYGDISILKESTSVYRISSKGQWAGLSEAEKRYSFLSDLQAMDKFFDFKYHKLCKKYKFKLLFPRLCKIKHSCGLVVRRAFDIIK